MATVKYRDPSQGMQRMVAKKNPESRPSVGMTEVKGEIFYFSTDLLIPYHNQSRKKFSEQGLNDLAASIKEQGILQPLLVIKSKLDEGKFEVVSGERRLRAAILVSLDKVPCKILDKDSDADYIAIMENIQREDLHPIELGNAYADLAKIHSDLTQEQIANKIGITRQKFQEYHVFSAFPEDVKEHLIKNNITSIHALRSIAKIKSHEEMRGKVFKEDKLENLKKVIMKVYYDGTNFSIGGTAFSKLDGDEKAKLNSYIHKTLL